MAKLRIMCVLLLLAVLLGNSAGSPAQARFDPPQASWQLVPNLIPKDVTLNGVFIVPDNASPSPHGYPAAIAVGENSAGQGVVYVVGGTRQGYWVGYLFQTVATPLRAVVSVGGVDWMVGDGVIIKDVNGRYITENAGLGPNDSLRTIQMFGYGDEGWAAGTTRDGNTYRPLLLHYKGGQWQRDNSVNAGNNEGTINSLHFAPEGGWLVGSIGIWRYHDGGWSKEDESAPCNDGNICGSYLNSVRAINGDEAWAFGGRSGTCAICVSQPYAIHRQNDRWQLSLPDAGIGGPRPTNNPQAAWSFSASYFTDANNAFAGGTIYDYGRPNDPNGHSPLMVRYQNGAWNYEPLPAASGGINAIYGSAPYGALAVGEHGLLLAYGYPNLINWANPVDKPNDPNITYFSETGHTLNGGFRDYWQQHGGLTQFGYPLTEEFAEQSDDGNTYTVQYFERNRFEYHPESPDPYKVQLGLLGRRITAGRESEPPFQPAPAMANPDAHYFSETSHNLSGPFLDYWQQHGGLAVYGYPISEQFTEVSPSDGKSYSVQYFERNRFEYHPELPDPYKVSLGLLGKQTLQERGWLP